MDGRYLLDTNVIISLFAGVPHIHDRVAKAIEVFVSSVAVGELYFGAYKSLRPEENVSLIDEFTLHNTVLACDAFTAKKYGDIKNRLKEKGSPIPENDIWIAATAQQYALTLLTKDSHFKEVEDLSIETW